MECEKNTQNTSTYPVKCNNTCAMDKKQYMPIQSLGPEIYTFIYKVVVVNLNNHIKDNNMPKCIARDEFNLIVNDCMCDLTKQEKRYKEMLKSRATKPDDDTRAFCSNCNGLLKSVVEIALITSLLNGGCVFCY